MSRLIATWKAFSASFTLFIRPQGPPHPDPGGTGAAREVELSFIGLEAIRQAAKDLREFRTGSLKIATMPRWLCPICPIFAHRFPRQPPRLHPRPAGPFRPDRRPSVATQRVDVGFAVHWRTDPAIMFEVLAAAPLNGGAAADFPLPADGVVRGRRPWRGRRSSP